MTITTKMTNKENRNKDNRNKEHLYKKDHRKGSHNKDNKNSYLFRLFVGLLVSLCNNGATIFTLGYIRWSITCGFL